MMGGGSRAGSSRGGPAARGGRQTARRRPLTHSDRLILCNPTLRPRESLIHVHAVLGIPELLELILDYAIHDENADTLKSVRLVNKAWWTGVTNLMRKNKEPLFKLSLTKDNSLNGTPFVEAQGKLLDRFVAAMGQRVEGPFPTIKLNILEEFFRRENYDSLLTCLRQCGLGLVEVEMINPKNGGTLPGVMPPLDLPIMHKLSTTFTHQKVARHLQNIIGLTQVLLNGAPSLKIITVPYYRQTNIAYSTIAPRNFELLTFPGSITKLDLKCRMTSENLDVLTRNKLPNLLTLTLLLDNVSYTEGLFSKIMNNFSEHLRTLNVIPASYNVPPRHVNFVRFPVMNKLTDLNLNHGLELEEGHSPLSDCFPKLEGLSLFYQTPEMLRKWTANTALNSVESVGVGLIDENQSGMNYENTLPFCLESMQRVHLAFPNITVLTLSLSSGLEECGLKYMFMEMRQLKILYITVDGSKSVVNSDYWDSVLIGLPLPLVAAFREAKYRERVQLNTEDGVPTIRMLTALESLTLNAVVEPEIGQDPLPPLISNLTFKFALMKMTNLEELYLHGRFRVSLFEERKATNQMTTEWENMGRYIEYSSK